jgi:hypothetical protein
MLAFHGDRMSAQIERKLSVICPYLVTAKHLGSWGPYVVYTGYSYLGEVFVLLAGFGIANPVLAFLSNGQDAPGAKHAHSSSVVDFVGSSLAGWLSVGLLVIWGLVKFYISREDLEKRCSLLKSYRRQCAQLEIQLWRALGTDNPMPALVVVQTKLEDLVDRSIAERAIPDGAIDEKFNDEAGQYSQALVTKYGSNWTNVPPEERTQK